MVAAQVMMMITMMMMMTTMITGDGEPRGCDGRRLQRPFRAQRVQAHDGGQRAQIHQVLGVKHLFIKISQLKNPIDFLIVDVPRLLGDSSVAFTDNCVTGIEANRLYHQDDDDVNDDNDFNDGDDDQGVHHQADERVADAGHRPQPSHRLR